MKCLECQKEFKRKIDRTKEKLAAWIVMVDRLWTNHQRKK